MVAAAVVIGSAVILSDPIFHGLAISLMAGEVASTLLSRIAVPVLYYQAQRRFPRKEPVVPKMWQRLSGLHPVGFPTHSL
jgi:hypothetical protein